MSAPLRIEQRQSAGVLVLQLHGRLVAEEGAPLFKDHVTAALDSGSRDLLVDLSDVPYMDSGGVGVLVAMFTRTGRRGGRFKLLCPTPRTCRVLEITGLLQVFEVFDDEAVALHSFATRKPATAGTGPGQRLAG
jgi:anti-sigma B factor antagonist